MFYRTRAHRSQSFHLSKGSFVRVPARFTSHDPHRVPPWKPIFAKKGLDMNAIDLARSNRVLPAHFKDLKKLDPVTHKLVCRVCTKPNALSVTECTSCEFPLSPLDVDHFEPNVFLKIIQGKSDHAICYRDSTILIFEDKFPISDHHLDAIPIDVITDIRGLRGKHVPLLEHLYNTSLEILRVKEIPRLRGKDLRDYVLAGFNLPVSVYHLHLHMVVPPLRHLNAFMYPRFHPYHKVIKDLKQHGSVRVYADYPSPEEGEEFYRSRVLGRHHELSETSIDGPKAA